MTGSRERWVVRACVAGLLAVLCFLAGFSVVTQQRVATESKRADTAMKLSATFQDARHWVTEAKSIERAYHFEGSSTVRFAYGRATQDLDADLHHVVELDPSPANRAAIDKLLGLSARYKAAATDLFAAIDRDDLPSVQRLDHEVIDPIFGVLEYFIHQQAQAASKRALVHSASLREHEAHATHAITVAFGVGLVLLACFALVIVRIRRAEVCAPRPDRDQRPADRAAQPPRLPGGPGARAAAGEPHRRPAVAGPARPRRAEGRQRPLRPPGRRRAPAGGRRGDPVLAAGGRPRVPDRRRRVRRDPGRRPGARRARVRPARARDSWRSPPGSPRPPSCGAATR